MGESDKDKRPISGGVFIEDALIVFSIGLLFVLTVFFRDEPWGQRALLAVLVVMVVVFVRRIKRTHGAFKGR